MKNKTQVPKDAIPSCRKSVIRHPVPSEKKRNWIPAQLTAGMTILIRKFLCDVLSAPSVRTGSCMLNARCWIKDSVHSNDWLSLSSIQHQASSIFRKRKLLCDPVNIASGLTLVELIISLAIIGIIMVGLHQVVGTTIGSYQSTKGQLDLMSQARYAMERMVMFIQETDSIAKPDSDSNQEIIRVSERLLDTFNNTSHNYAIDGDGIPDADNDSNNLVNDVSGVDPPDYATFDLDKTDANDWKLMEQMPDYSTASLGDFTAKRTIAEHVKSFSSKLLSNNLVEIQLTLSDGKGEVALKTRVRARLVD